MIADIVFGLISAGLDAASIATPKLLGRNRRKGVVATELLNNTAPATTAEQTKKDSEG